MVLPPEITATIAKVTRDYCISKLQIDLLQFSADTILDTSTAEKKFEHNTVTTILMYRVCMQISSNSPAPVIPILWSDISSAERAFLRTLLQEPDMLAGSVKTIIINASKGTTSANLFLDIYERLDRLERVYHQAIRLLQ